MALPSGVIAVLEKPNLTGRNWQKKWGSILTVTMRIRTQIKNLIESKVHCLSCSERGDTLTGRDCFMMLFTPGSLKAIRP